MDERYAREKPMAPAQVRALLWDWIKADPGRAERLAMGHVRRFPTVLEAGDALSIVAEAVEHIEEMADRRDVHASGLLGLLRNHVRWTALRRVRGLRPVAELPSGLGNGNVDEEPISPDSRDWLTVAVQRRRGNELTDELRSAAALAALDRLLNRARSTLPAAVAAGEVRASADQLRAVGESAVTLKSESSGAGALGRKRLQRGRAAIVAWMMGQARDGEREVLEALARRATAEGRRGWRTALLEQAGLHEMLAATPSEADAADVEAHLTGPPYRPLPESTR